MINLLWVLSIPLFFFIYFLYKWLKVKKFKNNYILYWEIKFGKKSGNLPSIQHKKNAIVALLKGAGIYPRRLSVTRREGYGYISRQSANSFDNLFYEDVECILYNTSALSEAIEVYKGRMFASINPMVWLDIVLFLPQKFLDYLGANPDTVSAKILNFIYWIATPLLFEPIRAYLIDLIGLWK